MSDGCCRPTHTFESGAYNATQVRLYGLETPPLSGKNVDPDLENFFSGFRTDGSKVSPAYQGLVVKLNGNGSIVIINDGANVSSGIIYAYAYEGHCYDLPKPKIMYLPVPASPLPDDDCQFGCKSSEGYKVWIVDKLSQCVEIEANRGTIEELVLEANLPGKRSPSTYRATAMVAHRSGKLME